ncbi:MAG: hydrogenase expression/formation protein HypE [Bacteroidales bacterium]|nr:hydrogenase expression/formation protein HypE [Bacteroidales bacterium]
MNQKTILLGHGSGGKMSHDLIESVFSRYFKNDILLKQTDAAVLQINQNRVAFTTDSFVVDPLFFPGGNIGKLAVAGTVNDIAVSGAIPQYLSAGFIIEEGFPLYQLEEIVQTMSDEAAKAGVQIVTGDTKVVDKGKCDKLFINTSGVGILPEGRKDLGLAQNVEPGDVILVNGAIGSHGMAIMAARNELNIGASIASDCACLNGLIDSVLSAGYQVKFMRDATRGGLGTVLAELAGQRRFGLEIQENKLAIDQAVRGMCELLGFDPLYVANEGKVVMIVARQDAENVVKLLKEHPLGQEASIIGTITDKSAGKAWLQTVVGGKRVIEMLSGQQLPRIC